MRQNLLFRREVLKLPFTVLAFMLLFVIESYGQTITNNTQGTHDGFFYSFWNDGQSGSASMTLGPGGNYSTTWNNINNFTAGKGWKTGKPDRTVCFEGSYNGGNNGFLAVYGWTKDPLIEYYVVESYGNWTPPGNTSDIIHKGSFTSDGGTYNIYVSTRTNKPSIIGTATFQQYWSVRTTKRSTGTVTFANHIEKWKSLGMNMGTTWDYQIMESEGYQSSGSSNITVSECASCATPAPTVTATVNYEVGDVASTLTASGTNLKWYTTASGGTGSTNAPTPNTSAEGTTVYYVSSTANSCEGPRSSITVNVRKTYKIFKAFHTPVIDGEIDGQWQDPAVTTVSAGKTIVQSVTNAADLSGNIRFLWDYTNVYFYAVITDDAKQNDSQNSYEDDAIEVYFDINNDKATSYGGNDVQYSFGWNDGTVVGALPTGRSVSGIQYVAVSTNTGYIVEGSIPWATLQGNPQEGQLVGIEFMINDDDNGTGRDGKLSWTASTDDAWQNPSLFGVAKLEAQEIVTSLTGTQMNGISVFPNPAKNFLHIEGMIGAFDYKILDNTGRAIKVGNSESKIELQNIQKGIYILDLIQDERKETVKIIIE